MKQTFDYLENIPNIAATVCDKEGIVLYQNAAARQRDGEVVGQNLYDCHSPKSGEKIRMMMATQGNGQAMRHGRITRFSQRTCFRNATYRSSLCHRKDEREYWMKMK